jgi:pyruvate formate-lyase activating enzyme-like uncharacterized protein
MQKIKITSGGGMFVGDLPDGCKLCLEGAKLVLFLTGLCRRGCFYCPLSRKRRGKDVVYANERPVRGWREIVREAEEMKALGSGITGGDPLLRFRRMLRYVRLLKGRFGREHHVHVYLCTPVSVEKLRRMREAGVDEVRFHLFDPDQIARAREVGLDAGVEIPAIPGWEERIIGLLGRLDGLEGAFVNLNELEFSETNAAALRRRRMRLRDDSDVAVEGSMECAVRALEWATANTSLRVHYCPSYVKDSVQLRNRLIRKALNIAKPHEEVNEDGLLFKGVVVGLKKEELQRVRMHLLRKYRLRPWEIHIDRQKRRLELRWDLAERLAKTEKNLRFALVEEYPTYDRLETSVIPL